MKLEPSGDVEKLPKWAQEHIKVLTNELRQQTKTVVELRGEHPESKVSYSDYLSEPTYLNPDTQVHFETESGRVTVGFGSYDLLRISTQHGALIVKPQSANSIHVMPEKF